MTTLHLTTTTRRPADIVSIGLVFYLLVLTIGRLYRSANVVSAEYSNFAYPLSFYALVRGDSLQIYGKALRFLKLESSGQPTAKIW